MDTSRRLFLRGLIAAPAIVKSSSLMPVRLFHPYWHEPVLLNFSEIVFAALRNNHPTVVGNVSDNNALLRYLKKKGCPVGHPNFRPWLITEPDGEPSGTTQPQPPSTPSTAWS
jgi:hypothetical protein